MYGKYFYYNSHTSQDFNLMIAGFNMDDNVPLGLSRNILKGSMNRFRKTPNFMGTAYADTLSFSVQIVKDMCEVDTQDDMIFTEDEVDEITSWITAPNYPVLFHMYDYEPEVFKKYDYFAVCSDIQAQTLGEDIVGFTI